MNERAEALEARAREVATLAEPEPEVTRIATALPDQLALYRERSERTQRLVADPPSMVALEDDLRMWDFERTAIAAARDALTARLVDLDAVLEELSQLRGVWKATEEAARQAVAPDAVVGRIQAARATLRELKRKVEARRDAILHVQTDVAEAQRLADDSYDAVKKARKSFRSLLLLRDKPPLWRVARAPDRTPLLEEVRARLADQSADLREFGAARWEHHATQLLLLAVCLAGGLALRRRGNVWRSDDPRLEASSVILERPYSAAFLVVLGSTQIFHPNAPRVVDGLAAALVIVPALRLLPRLLEPAAAPAVYALASFAVLDQLRHVLGVRVFGERLLLLAETLAAAALAFWMLRPARLAELPSGTRVPRALGTALRVALGLLVIAALANVTGWLNLSRALSEGVLRASYLAVVLYAIVRVARTAVRAFLRSSVAERLGVVRRHAAAIQSGMRRLIHAAAGLSWAWYTLVAFGIDDWAVDAARGALAAEAAFGTIAVSLGDVLAFAATIVAAWLLSRGLRTILEDDVVPRLPARRGLGHALTTTVQYAVLALGFLLAVSAAGVDLNRVSLLAGALGVGVGFGLQNVVNNFVSGLILLYERPIQLGDTVEVGGLTGQVKRIGIRSCTIQTAQGAEVIVPNGNLISDRVVNWTFSDQRRRMEVKVGVAYGTDPERVIALLESVARGHPEVLDEPPPQALFVGFGESSLDFELRAWTALFESWMATQSELAVRIAHALAEAGIDIPFPQREIRLRPLGETKAAAPVHDADA